MVEGRRVSKGVEVAWGEKGRRGGEMVGCRGRGGRQATAANPR